MSQQNHQDNEEDNFSTTIIIKSQLRTGKKKLDQQQRQKAKKQIKEPAIIPHFSQSDSREEETTQKIETNESQDIYNTSNFFNNTLSYLRSREKEQALDITLDENIVVKGHRNNIDRSSKQNLNGKNNLDETNTQTNITIERDNQFRNYLEDKTIYTSDSKYSNQQFLQVDNQKQRIQIQPLGENFREGTEEFQIQQNQIKSTSKGTVDLIMSISKHNSEQKKHIQQNHEDLINAKNELRSLQTMKTGNRRKDSQKKLQQAQDKKAADRRQQDNILSRMNSNIMTSKLFNPINLRDIDGLDSPLESESGFQFFSDQEENEITEQKAKIDNSKRRQSRKKKEDEGLFQSDIFTQDNQLKRIYRKHPRKKWIIYPDGSFKSRWDALITLPYAIAFLDQPTEDWLIINTIVDCIFLVDIVVNFYSAYMDKEYEMIDDRKVIVKSYLYSWFIVDLLSIIPFDQIFASASYNRLARVVRIGKIYKIIKMTRLVRMLKIVKERSKFVKYLNEVLKIGIGFERLLFMILIFLVLCHITACLWIFTARFDEGSKINWIFQNEFQDYDDGTLYLTSFYYTVTTIVTVGYGDIHAYSSGEKFMSIILMIIGVIAFSFATGSLSSIISNYDASQAQLKEKMATLNDIKSKYNINADLFDDLRKTIKYDHSKNYHDVIKFMEELPFKLKIDLALEIHKNIYREIEFFKKQDKNFIVWVCPLLRPYLVTEQDYIFKEGDDIKEIYFLEKGVAGYVIPRFNNIVYIQIEKGDHFGHIDLVYDQDILNQQTNIKKKAQKNKDLVRRFTIQAIINCELQILSLENIDKMKVEFSEVFDHLFSGSRQRLQKILKLKIDAMQQCENSFQVSNASSNLQSGILNRLKNALQKANGMNSQYIQEYKNKNMKKMLTISDVNKVANYAKNRASLKQIDEELESLNESGISESGDPNSLKSKEIADDSCYDSQESSEELDDVAMYDKISKANKTKQQAFRLQGRSGSNIQEEAKAEEQEKETDVKNISEKEFILKFRRKFGYIFKKEYQKQMVEEIDMQSQQSIQQLNTRVDSLESMMQKLILTVSDIGQDVKSIKDTQIKLITPR
ncbi:cation channel family protein [Stylonychia lemnae]|uniref:Cation channel family protein n=1 Tax=Stylonychia lemnae TaxID=5949 RepID=A0A078AYV8_STYLE|nr:cation channel family protein [Stylonychia lemnae]|eukprot:CDW86372.1 cation channel family protein [Stylonychia lemnae]